MRCRSISPMRGSVACAWSLLCCLAISGFLERAPVLHAGSRVPGTQEKRPSYTASSRLVLLDVCVQEKSNGQPVSGLLKEDFEIYDEGEPRDIAHCDTEPFMLDVILVLDMTSRVGARAMPTGESSYRDFYKAVVEAVRRLGELDRLGVVSMSANGVALLANLEYEKGNSLRAIRDALFGPVKPDKIGPPRLYPALILAGSQFRGEQELGRRRLVLVWTHNRALRNEGEQMRVIDLLRDRSVTVAGIVTPLKRLRAVPQTPSPGSRVPAPPIPPRLPPVPPGPLPDPRPRTEVIEEAETYALDPVVESTGGTILRPPGVDLVNWDEFLGRVRWKYRLAFYPPPHLPSGIERRLEVRLTAGARQKCRDCFVTARSSYLVP